MDYVKPADVALCMVETGRRKLGLSSRDLMLRGALAGGILGIATSLAFTATVCRPANRSSVPSSSPSAW
jgi:formate/nitrite transporter FocA (FNT family)